MMRGEREHINMNTAKFSSDCTCRESSREYYWNDYGKGSNMTLSFIIRFNDLYYPYKRTKREAVL